jgi:hypothetical protein
VDTLFVVMKLVMNVAADASHLFLGSADSKGVILAKYGVFILKRLRCGNWEVLIIKGLSSLRVLLVDGAWWGTE